MTKGEVSFSKPNFTSLLGIALSVENQALEMQAIFLMLHFKVREQSSCRRVATYKNLIVMQAMLFFFFTFFMSSHPISLLITSNVRNQIVIQSVL